MASCTYRGERGAVISVEEWLWDCVPSTVLNAGASAGVEETEMEGKSGIVFAVDVGGTADVVTSSSLSGIVEGGGDGLLEPSASDSFLRRR
jgi:hypothetical protein